MGLFITFEGVEGCGKSTQVRLLTQCLAARGHEILTTREPGGCPIADKIRSILLDAANSEMTSDTELLLYAAARAQHVSQVIRPALLSGKTVLCDRFTDATLAYQGYGRKLDSSLVVELNRIATSGLAPDITVLIDCPVEIGLERAMDRINKAKGLREERFELESLTFHESVRTGYLTLAAAEPERFLVIDGRKDIRGITDAIMAGILPRLPEA